MTEKTETKSTKRAFGKKLDKRVKFTWTWKEYDTPEEMQAAGEGLSLEQQRKARNRIRKMSARTKSLNAALEAAGIEEPTILNDDQMLLKQFYDTLMAVKGRYTPEQARALAAEMTGKTWAEVEDDEDDDEDEE